MENLFKSLIIPVNEKIFQKDPFSSELGLKIIQESINLIDQFGFEQFNFKKLATQLSTAESSIYRYFDNKHKLLIYLFSWYWSWLAYRLVFATNNVAEPEKRIEKAIQLVANPILNFEMVNHFNIDALSSIIVNESSKVYLTKEVETDNQEGCFEAYKSFCNRISLIIQEINPQYPFPNSLVSTIIEGVHLQKYLAKHLPSLTDSGKSNNDVEEMFTQLVFKTVKNN